MPPRYATRCSRILENPRVNLDDLSRFDFALPSEQIAQHPPDERDGGRLMHLDRRTGSVEHSEIRALPALLRDGDLLVTNATRVLAARLRGHKASGGAAEALLLGASQIEGRYRALIRHSGRLRAGRKYRLGTPALDAELLSVDANGIGVLGFEPGIDPYAAGETPLPPYIRRDTAQQEDETRYQTTFARVPGSVAAPTAGLHLSERLLEELEQRGIERAEVILHVGPGTFRPLREQDLASHRLHAERFELPESTAEAIAKTRARGGAGGCRRNDGDPRARNPRYRRSKRPRRLGNHGSLSRTGRWISRHRRAAHQLPPAALIAAVVGRGVRGSRERAGRLCRSRARGVPLLFLWRCHANPGDAMLIQAS
jgi:S-adenosylmethionine:tRNA ribosyltransferase-isomerase